MPPPKEPITQEERDAIKAVKLKSFKAAPGSVPVFGSTLISWNVTLPNTNAVDISVELNRVVVPASGSKTFNLSQNTSFTLNARSENLGRQLRSLTVTVNDSECRSKLLDAFLITQSIKVPFDRRFSGSSEFKLDPETEVTLDDGLIGIRVPLEIEVPNWFNAKMVISIQLAVFGFTVTARLVHVNAGWSFFEHLASLGCTGFVQSGMEQISEAFMKDIVKSELIPKVSAALKEQADSFVKGLQDSDPKKRTYQVKTLTISRAGATIVACPKV